MRLVFMGTTEFSVATLAALHGAGHEIACVYSQPPRPAGRGYALKPSPVQNFAEANGIEVRTPQSLKSEEEQHRFAALKAESAIVVAYGLLLPKPVLDAPRHGCFNVHASLLPRWRGAAPIQRAIMAGDSETGITIMKMEQGLDTGPMLLVKRVAITAETTCAALHDLLAPLGAKAMLAALHNLGHPLAPQPEAGVTYARKIDKAEAHIDFSKTATEVRNHIHGLSPFPGAWCVIDGARIKVLATETIAAHGAPGTVVDDALTIACGRNAVRLLKLQREGKAAMDAVTFLRGHPVKARARAT